MVDRRRRTEAERAIIYAGVMGRLSNARIDQLLAQIKARPLPSSSYDWVKRGYVPYFHGDPDRLGRAIEHPPTAGQIKASIELDLREADAANDDLSGSSDDTD